MSATVVSFGEWLPDQPALNLDGLTVANNVVPDLGFYRPYQPLTNFAATLPGIARGLLNVYDEISLNIFYGATAAQLFVAGVGAANFTARSTSLVSNTIYDWSFVQFDNLVFACNYDNTVYHTIRATSNFLTSAAPGASIIAKVNRFVVVGDLNDSTARPNVIRWSAIDQPTNWPTPNSSTAIATQAGEQVLNKSFGYVNGISTGDQNSVIFQDYGITRMTYVGPPVVFQFDEIEKSRGAARQSIVRAGGVTYFYAGDGFYKTDGVSVIPIGEGKVDNYFKTNNGPSIIRAVFNQQRETIQWCFSSKETTVTTVPNKVFSFHIPSGRWSAADDQLLSVDISDLGAQTGPYAFDENNILSAWNRTAAAIATATITTGDLELNPGGRFFVSGIKPNIESTSTTSAVTVRIGTRTDLGTVPSYTATTIPTVRTGFADVRVDAKYHRAETQIVGVFDKAVGIEFKGFLTGET